MSRFFPVLHEMVNDDLSDTIYAIASNIEDALIASGAEAGEHYTRMDLIGHAMPFALERFRENAVSFTFPARQTLTSR